LRIQTQSPQLRRLIKRDATPRENYLHTNRTAALCLTHTL
jgi:hypothetical protein